MQPSPARYLDRMTTAAARVAAALVIASGPDPDDLDDPAAYFEPDPDDLYDLLTER